MRCCVRIKVSDMRSVTMSICVAFVLVIGGARLGGLLAQTAPEPQTHYKHGQGYQHSFQDAEKWAKAFDDPARDAWQKPDEILNALHLQRTDRVADLGAGTGYFSVRIAKLVPDGKLFAVDIEPDMLRHLRQRAHHDNLSVLVPILASAESANLPEPVDLVIVVDTPNRQPRGLLLQIKSVVANQWTARHRGFHGGFVGGATARPPHPIRTGHLGTGIRRLYAGRK